MFCTFRCAQVMNKNCTHLSILAEMNGQDIFARPLLKFILLPIALSVSDLVTTVL